MVLDPSQEIIHSHIHMKIKGDKMTLIDEESEHLVYQRVVPDLDPGK